MSDQSIRSIAIVGGGSAGWMAAALMSRLLDPRHCRIVLVESDAIGTVGVGEATIPPVRQFNALIGVDERAFLAETKGSFKLGIEFVGWGAPDDRYMHTFGPIGQLLGSVRLHHYWLQARARRPMPPLEDYCINAAAMRGGKFTKGLKDRPSSPLNDLTYAYHFDATLYGRHLRRLSEARGVQRIEGRIVEVRRNGESGLIEDLLLDDGEAVAADFFIDASGFRSLLLGETLGVPYESWSHWLPCDRALAVPCASMPRIEPYTRATARPAGWQWRIPLQHRIGNGMVYASAAMSDDAAASILLANLDAPALADPRPIRFAPGRRVDAWRGNCVAIGLAGGFLEPLESTSLHMVQAGLIRLMGLFPDKGFDAATIAEYNRQTARDYDHIRDFVILHYKATQRADTEFWRYCAAMHVPDSLQERIDVFKSRGRSVRRPDELFTDESWIQVMLGQNVIPAAPDGLVFQHSDDEIDRFLSDVRQVIARCADAMPAHEAALAALHEDPAESIPAVLRAR